MEQEDALARLAVERGLATSGQLADARSRGASVSDALRALGVDSAMIDALAGEARDALASTMTGAGATPAAPAAPGTTFGKYAILGKLGKGGMGIVYRAHDPAGGREVAIKCMLETENDVEVRRFLREASTATALTHPNIVAVYEIDEHERTPYIVMEYVRGASFARRLNPRAAGEKRMSLREAVRVIRDVARALHYAHEKGIVHRDVKPENVMIDESGTPKLMDFGLARELKHGATLTTTGHVMGTPYYMSPEQAQGRRGAIDGRSDVWALGVMLYEVVTKQMPFEGETPAEVLHRIVHEETPDPRRVEAATPAGLDAVILTCLEHEPQRRYGTAAALADDLDRFLAGRPVAARRPGLLRRLSRRARRRRALVAAAAAGVAAIALAIVLAGVMRGRTAERGRAQADLQRSERLRKLEERLRPLEGLIKETRPFFYVKAVNMREKLDRVEAALEELQRLAADPALAELPDTWAALGAGWYFVGDAQRAEESLLKAVGLDADHPSANYHLARVYLEQSQAAAIMDRGTPAEIDAATQTWVAKALAHMKRASGWRGAEEIDRVAGEAYAALMENRRGDATRICEEALRRFGSTVGAEEFWNILGWTRQGAEFTDAYTKAIEIRPHYAWGYFRRGNNHSRSGRPQEAITDLDAAIRLNPRLACAHAARGIARRAVGDFDGAIADHTEAIRVNPRYSLAYCNRGTAKGSRGDLKGALADFDEALRISPDYAYALANRAGVRWASGDPDGAIADCEAALRLDPANAAALTNRGMSRNEKGDVDGAIADLDEAVRLRPDHADIRTNRSIVRIARRDLPGALEDLTEALRLDPRNSLAFAHRSAVHLLMNRPREALQDLEEAIRLNPKFARAYASRGTAKEMLGDIRGAFADYDEAIRLNPAEGDAWVARGNLKLLTREFEGAIADLNEGVRLKPRDTDALMRRAVALARKGDVDASLADLEEILRINPKHAGAYMNRGSTFQRKREFEKALADFERAHELAKPDSPMKAAAERAIKMVRQQIAESKP